MTNSASDALREVWSWTKPRLLTLWECLVWAFNMVCLCGACRNSPSTSSSSSFAADLERGNARNSHNSRQMAATTSGNAAAGVVSAAGAAIAGGQVHKVIMVGSGGVGKSALTLQFMYEEVILICIRKLKSEYFVFSVCCRI